MSKLRESARGEDCLVRLPYVCKHQPEYVILSHYRGSAGGKGGSIKSIDMASAYCCTACDAVYDGQVPRPAGVSKEEVDLAWLEGHIRTLVRMREIGLIR
jgi:hypothetical protein